MDAALFVVALAIGQVTQIPAAERPVVMLDYEVDFVEFTDVVEEGYDKLPWFGGEDTWVYAPTNVASYVVFWRAGTEDRLYCDGCYVLRQLRHYVTFDCDGGGEGSITVWGLTTFDYIRHGTVTYGVRVRFKKLVQTRRRRHPLEGHPIRQRWRLPTP